MAFPKLPPLDAFSFFAGTLFGILFYYLVIEKKYVHKLISISKLIYDRVVASSNLDKAELLIKKILFNQAQSNHLLSHVFPLESIIIPPKLLFPPKYLYPEFYTSSSSLINQFFPYTPDWPELSAQFPVDTISYDQLANVNGKTLIIGQPGSGKTVLLSALVLSIIKDNNSNILPILLSAKTILPYLKKEEDALEIITSAFAENNPQISPSQIFYIIKSKISSKEAILLVDDLDHLHSDENEKILAFLSTLETQHHFSKIIIAANPNSIGRELSRQYFPLSIASWSIKQQNTYLNKFKTAWELCKFQDAQKSNGAIQASVFSKWLQDETPYYSPYDLSIRSWLLYSGNRIGNNIFDYIMNIIRQFNLDAEEIEQLALFAYALIRSNKSSLDISEANSIIEQQKVVLKINIPDTVHGQDVQQIKTTQKIQDFAFATLQKFNIVTQNSFGAFSFSSPIWAGIFSSLINGEELSLWITKQTLNWSYASQFMRFTTINNQADSWYETIFQKVIPFPFDNTYLKLARFIPDLPIDHPVRNGILNWIAKSSFQQQLPATERAQLFAALLISKDPSVPKLLLEFQSMPDPDLRFLAVLTYAAFSNNDHFKVFIEHLGDEEQNVRNAASLAFFSLKHKKSTDILIDILLQGDEYMKQTAAESIALMDSISKDLLSEAITSEDLLIRRAAVYGLSRINEQWATDILSHAAIEDAQWIVRNAASQIVENRDLFKTMLIPQLPHPSNAPWLIGFASKLGKGIPKSGFVKDILLSALDQGTMDEKISAMNYLRVVPDMDIVRAILPLLMHKNKSMQQASTIALWYIEKIMGNIPIQKEKRIS